MSKTKFIKLREVRQNNLKGFDLELPFYKLVVVTGVSGAGKSSLVFDTLYAEGQRRYVETFSSYLRQYFERLPRPRVKEILNIPPALAFPQGNSIKTSRSTVATLTEISHFTKMLFYHAGIPRCPNCGIELKNYSAEDVAREVIKRFKGKKILITTVKKPETSWKNLREGLLAYGFSRILVGNQVCDVEEVEELPGSEVEVLLYRVKPSEEEFQSILEAVEQGFKIGSRVKVKTLYGEELTFLKDPICPVCGFKPPEKSPNLFSFNSSQGACPECNGFGNLLVVDMEALVKEPLKPVTKGAIPLLQAPFLIDIKYDLMEYLKEKGIPLSAPFANLPENLKKAIFDGEGKWYGLKEVINWLESKKYKQHIRILLSKLRREVPCPKCKGTRFNQKALTFYVNGLNIGEFYELDVLRAKEFVTEIISKTELVVVDRVAREILRRLEYLEEVGLSYLSLSRTSRTLSGGEAGRCLLTRALASNLVETLYIIDEPTTGLHPKDTDRILRFMEKLVSQRNTVVVVEHDPEVILSADVLVDLGPEGGEKGGNLLFNGHPEKILSLNTPTSQAIKEITSKRKLEFSKNSFSKFVEFENANVFNLKNISVKIPLNAITCIVGPSGSGKSTLLEKVIYERAKEEFTGKHFSEVSFLTQEPLAKSPRAVVATYAGIFPFMRRLLASTKEAKALGYSENYFSFNSELAQCPECKGLGYEIIEMQFLSDLTIPCEVCKGTRYKKEVLEVRWRGKNIAEMLDLTVSEAIEFFGSHPLIKKPLQILESLGLGYLKLGQPLSTLSGGEAQRLRIASVLNEVKGKNALILLDEPTVGLHLKDVSKLTSALKLLVEQGHTIIIVEHHPEVMLASDWIVELGPEGGEKGGYLLFQGETRDFLKKNTVTASYLKDYANGLSIKEISQKKKNEYSYQAPFIKIRGLRHHNLKNIDVDIPREKFVVVTGVSGSGKSTLAFDVIFSEGQRRFLETLPAYLRQFFKLHEEVDFDLISGIPPTVALEQKSGELSPKSTVGTLTEVLSYLRLLYARLSKSYCPRCGREVGARTRDELFELLLNEVKKKKEELTSLSFFAPLVRYRKGFYKNLFEKLLKLGYHTVRIDKRLRKIPPIPRLSRYKEHFIEVMIGKVEKKDLTRENLLRELFFKALDEGKEEAIVAFSGKKEEEYFFSKKRACLRCGISLPDPDPLLFAFNTKQGMCTFCSGLGVIDGKVCPECKGTRYRKEVFFYKINGFSLPELCDVPVNELLNFFKTLTFKGREKIIGEELVSEITSRLECLCDLGLGYLTLGRGANTLSSGEAKRVRIAGEVGSNLTGVAYVLDEPTIGLHPRDTKKLIGVLKKLRDKGNTVIVVEHDEDVILSSDFVVDMGKGGGRKGGEVIFSGSPKDLMDNENSVTGKALKTKERKKLFSKHREPEEFLEVKGVKFRNLKCIDVKFPKGCLTVVVGVSGSGKSSLVCDLLYPVLKDFCHRKREDLKLLSTFKVEELMGWEDIHRIYLVDHSPIGNTPRSTPATYINAFTEIRKFFANSTLARERGYREGMFSFNTEEGACPRCKGQGSIKVEVKFLPEVYQVCEACRGKRYKTEVLEVKLKGKSIADVLEMDFEEAAEFFKNHPNIYRKLSTVCTIGLEYLLLGQPSPTLSGGEAQRIKLAKEFSKTSKKPCLFVLDEPTTGLHIKDVEKLAEVLQGLVEKGHTVIVIEHNFELIKHADWIIELGPKGGNEGGYLLFQGKIKDFLNTSTPTSEAFKDYLDVKS